MGGAGVQDGGEQSSECAGGLEGAKQEGQQATRRVLSPARVRSSERACCKVPAEPTTSFSYKRINEPGGHCARALSRHPRFRHMRALRAAALNRLGAGHDRRRLAASWGSSGWASGSGGGVASVGSARSAPQRCTRAMASFADADGLRSTSCSLGELRAGGALSLHAAPCGQQARAGGAGRRSRLARVRQHSVSMPPPCRTPPFSHTPRHNASVGGCSPDTPKVPADEIPALLAIIPAWRLAADGKSISRSFTAKNFVAGALHGRPVAHALSCIALQLHRLNKQHQRPGRLGGMRAGADSRGLAHIADTCVHATLAHAAVDFVNKLVPVAEAEGHHP